MGHGAVVRLLLEKEASIEAKDENKDTALYNAAYYGHRAIAKWLLEGGESRQRTSEWRIRCTGRPGTGTRPSCRCSSRREQTLGRRTSMESWRCTGRQSVGTRPSYDCCSRSGGPRGEGPIWGDGSAWGSFRRERGPHADAARKGGGKGTVWRYGAALRGRGGRTSRRRANLDGQRWTRRLQAGRKPW